MMENYIPLMLLAAFAAGWAASVWFHLGLKKFEKKLDDDWTSYEAGLPSDCDRFAAISRNERARIQNSFDNDRHLTAS